MAIADLAQPALHRFALYMAVDWAIIALTFFVAARLANPLIYALAILPLGSRQQGLGALFHDAAHRLASRNRLLNDLVGNLFCAFPLGLTLGGYRRYHFAHHRHLGTDLDPENTHKKTLPQWRLPAAPWRVVASFVSDLLGGGLPHLVAAGKLTRPVSIIEGGGLVLFWSLIFFAAWMLHALWIPILWIVAIATVFWSGVRLRIWTEHLGSADTHRIIVPWWLAQLIMPHHIGLHFEHHRHPAVPFWNLPRLRARLDASAGSSPSPPLVRLTTLVRGFLLSAPLPSGQVGITVGPGASSEIDEATLASRAAQLRTLSYFFHVVLPPLLGVVIYLLCRRALPRVLRWFPASGLLTEYVPARLVDFLPDMTWAYALTALQVLLWRDGPKAARYFWIASAPLVAAALELGQALHVVPGRFDWADLVGSLVACALAVIALHSGPLLRSPTPHCPQKGAPA